VNKPDKIIISNQLQPVMLLLGGIVLMSLILIAIGINADTSQSSGMVGFLPVVLMVVLLVFILMPRFFKLIGLMAGQPAMIEISDQVRTAGIFGGNERCYPLDDVVQVSLYKRHFELTLRQGQELSFSTANYSVAQLNAFFSHIGLHCTHESECELVMSRPASQAD